MSHQPPPHISCAYRITQNIPWNGKPNKKEERYFLNVNTAKIDSEIKFSHLLQMVYIMFKVLRKPKKGLLKSRFIDLT